MTPEDLERREGFFRCKRLSAVLSERSCAMRRARAREIRSDRPPRHDQLHLAECQGCELGLVHLRRHGARPRRKESLRILPRKPRPTGAQRDEVEGLARSVAARRAPRAERVRKSRRRPCERCGAPKVPGSGQRYCSTCKAERARTRPERARARKRRHRRRVLGTERPRTGRCAWEGCGAACTPHALYCEQHRAEARRASQREWARRKRAEEASE